MAVRTDAATDRLQRTANVPSSGAFTACGWAVRRSFGSVYSAIFGISNASSSPGIAIEFDWSSAGVLEFQQYNASTSDSFQFTRNPGNDAPFFWAVVSNGTTTNSITGYVRRVGDNDLESGQCDNVSFTAASLHLGNNGWGEGADCGHWNVKVWDRALTAAELLGESFFERVVYPTSLNFRWLLSGTGRTEDTSGNGRNPTVTGTLAADDGGWRPWRPGARVLSVVSGGDTTAPILTNPTGTATGSTTADVGATTDEGNGTLYAVVTTSSPQPTVAQIKASQDHTGAAAAWGGSQAVSSTGAKTLGATGLTAATNYWGHLVHTDAASNDSNRVSSAQFTTADLRMPGGRTRVAVNPRLWAPLAIRRMLGMPAVLRLAGGVVSDSLAETTTADDSVSATVVRASTIPVEAATGGDVASTVVAHPVTVPAEAASSADTVSAAAQDVSIVPVEAASSSETVSAIAARVATIPEEAAPGSDSISGVTGAQSATIGPEATSADDTTSMTLAAGGALVEAGAAIDTPSAILGTSASLTEASAAGDAVSVGVIISAMIPVEAGIGDDVVSGLIAIPASIAENAAATDAFSSVLAYGLALTEAATSADTIVAAAQFIASISELANALDFVISGAASVTLVESATAIDFWDFIRQVRVYAVSAEDRALLVAAEQRLRSVAG